MLQQVNSFLCIKASVVIEAFFVCYYMFIQISMPRSYFPLSFGIMTVLLVCVRFARVILKSMGNSHINGKIINRVMVVGAGSEVFIPIDSKKQRDRIQNEFKGAGIPTMVYYPKPMHKQLAFSLPNNYDFNCSKTERLCDTVLSLPIHPYLTDEDINEAVGNLKKCI